MKLRPKTVLSGVPVAVEIYESRPFRHTERVGACVGADSRERGVCLTEYDGAVLSYRDGVITSVHVTFHTTRSDHITTIDLDLAHTEHTRHRSTANSASCVATAEARDGCVSHPH